MVGVREENDRFTSNGHHRKRYALNISDNELFATVSAFTRQTDPIIVSYAEYHIVFIYKLFYTLHVYFPANKDIYKNVLFLANS